MKQITVYIGLVFLGTFVAYLAGTITEKWSQSGSLMVFLGIFFATLWLGWRVAVEVT